MRHIGNYIRPIVDYLRGIGRYLKRLARKAAGETIHPLMDPTPAAISADAAVTLEPERWMATGNDPLDNAAWVHLAEACVDLFAELENYQADFDPPRREIAEHVCDRLREILARSGVSLIDADSALDRNLHNMDPRDSPLKTDDAVVRVTSTGFYIGRRVLRRARVQLLQEASTSGV